MCMVWTLYVSKKIHTTLRCVENNKIPENYFPFELGSIHSGVQELLSGSSWSDTFSEIRLEVSEEYAAQI